MVLDAEAEKCNRRSFATRAQATLHVMQYIEVFYDRLRRHSDVGFRTPASVQADENSQTAAAASSAIRHFTKVENAQTHAIAQSRPHGGRCACSGSSAV